MKEIGEPILHPRETARRDPARPAFVFDDTGEVLTYGALTERADRAAQLFSSLGLVQGDTIAVLMENQIRFPELIWAAKDSGLRYVTISTQLNAQDAAYILGDCGAKLLIASRATADVASRIAPDFRHLALLMIDGAQPPFQSYEEGVARQPAVRLPGRARGASMLYSSGTTGRPKGIRTEIEDIPPETPPIRFPAMRARWEIDAETIFLNPGPLYHSAPLRLMMVVHRCGGTVIGFRRFDAARVLDAIGRHRATHGFFVPTMFSRLLALDPAIRAAAQVSTMRHAIHAAAPCPVKVKRAMIDWWGPVIDEFYSGTESIGHCFASSAEWLAHPGTVGRPSTGCSLKIVDADGVQLPPGVAGRVMMRNGYRMRYHGAAASKADIYDADGYATLGDIGYVDDEGFLYLTDRESNMIISGGVNIYPQEAEAVLEQHPAVLDVAVIGVPNADMGEEVKAVVQPTTVPADAEALEQELIQFCRDRLSPIKCPRSIDFVDLLPRSEAGKLLKRLVKQRYWPDQRLI
jgi:acyl-CoA synthetase (AMP-forming)/AMP-acid ligase II